MMISRRGGLSIAMVTSLALALTGCASSGTTSTTAYSETITPIQNTPVASSNLPALGASSQTVAGTPGQLSAPPALNPSLQARGLRVPQPGVTDQFGNPLTVGNNSNFVTVDSVGAVPSTPGRDLSTGLTVDKLLGGWTVVAGAQQCKINLTYTAKTGTNRYRASAPGCSLPGLSVLASWQLVGNQVQLFDEE
jgi:hypothetical protein